MGCVSGLAASHFPFFFRPKRKYFLLPQPWVVPLKAWPLPFEFAVNHQFESDFLFLQFFKEATVPFELTARSVH